MNGIKVLPEQVANRIAAGEVIERPASVVKELIENSLDAGASSIEVAIRHGGKSLIRVTDNGSGMSPRDAQLAFERHATSKISKAEDLFNIHTFGFRGEALPSMAAVSRLKIHTGLEGQLTGTEISMEGGKITAVKETTARKGTVMEIRDLYFNTPARRKFLKSDSTEAAHIIDMISHLAPSRLDVGFRLESSDKQIFDLSRGQSLLDRITELFGEDLGAALLEMDERETGMRISGFVGKPSASRANRTGQVFYVNGRWIKSPSLGYALRAGYHGLLMHGQFPIATLFFELDPAQVDVNVHPTKQEVRISQEARIKSILQAAVEKRVRTELNLAPNLSGKGDISSPRRDYFMPADGPKTQAYLISELPISVSQIAETKASFSPALTEIVRENPLGIRRVLGCIHQTFIVAESGEGLVLVDQHAAHERVNFEALCAIFKAGKPVRQKLLMDEVLELSAKHADLMIQEIPLLEKIGYEIEPFGKTSYVLRSVPAALEAENSVALIKQFLEEKEDGKPIASLERYEEEIAALIACKKQSVRAYEAMTPESMGTLLERLSRCSYPFSCPHGRPAFLKFTFSDLEKQFKRTR